MEDLLLVPDSEDLGECTLGIDCIHQGSRWDSAAKLEETLGLDQDEAFKLGSAAFEETLKLEETGGRDLVKTLQACENTLQLEGSHARGALNSQQIWEATLKLEESASYKDTLQLEVCQGSPAYSLSRRQGHGARTADKSPFLRCRTPASVRVESLRRTAAKARFRREKKNGLAIRDDAARFGESALPRESCIQECVEGKDGTKECDFQGEAECEEEGLMNTQQAIQTIYFMRGGEPPLQLEVEDRADNVPDGDIKATFTDEDAEAVATGKAQVTPTHSGLNKNLAEALDFKTIPDVIRTYKRRASGSRLGMNATVSKRRRIMTHHRVLFSHGLLDSSVRRQRKFLLKLGGEETTKVADCTHFVSSGNFTRSINMLEAMAAGKHVVTTSWLESSNVAGCFLQESNYILQDSKKEKELGFSMRSTLAAAQRSPLLQGFKVHVTPNTRPSKDEIVSIIKAAGGKAATLRVKSISFVISCEEDHDVCLPLIARGLRIYSTELLLHGIVAYKLEFSKFELFQS